jgi:hypothetical protein
MEHTYDNGYNDVAQSFSSAGTLICRSKDLRYVIWNRISPDLLLTTTIDWDAIKNALKKRFLFFQGVKESDRVAPNKFVNKNNTSS